MNHFNTEEDLIRFYENVEEPKNITEATEMIREIYNFFEKEKRLRQKIEVKHDRLNHDYNKLVEIEYDDEELQQFLKERG
jgi:hypothetical protein